MVTRRVEEALRHITEESGLYREPRGEGAQSFQVYLAVKTKRWTERAVARVQRGPGGQPDQKSLLQAAGTHFRKKSPFHEEESLGKIKASVAWPQGR